MALTNLLQNRFRGNIDLDIAYHRCPSSLTSNRSQHYCFSSSNNSLKLSNNLKDESRLNSNNSRRISSFVRSAVSEKTRGAGDWVDLYLPENVRSYARLARLEKPIGSWLLAWPFAWSLALAADQGSFPDVKTLAMFSLWAVAIRGAACTINDYFDRDIDSKVERTRNRPMACGDVTPTRGLLFFFIQVVFGLGPLLSTNTVSGILGLMHVPSVVAYPFMKRVTYWPQAFLGLMFNWGVVLGWSVVKGNLDPAVLIPLYMACFFWTLIYDTIYAHQDKKDDVKIGVKSTAVLLGDSTKAWLTVFGTSCVTCFALAGFNADIGYSFYPLLGIATCHLAWQIWTADLSSPTDCNNKFVSNIWFGAIIFSAIMMGRLSP